MHGNESEQSHQLIWAALMESRAEPVPWSISVIVTNSKVCWGPESAEKKVHSEVFDLHHRGFLHLHDQTYLIEPMAPAEPGLDDTGARSDEGLHAIYNYEHLRRKRSSCSHGNTTTFYDHGAHPSGLFQLSKLVKTHRVDVVLQFSSLHLIIDIQYLCCIDNVIVLNQKTRRNDVEWDTK